MFVGGVRWRDQGHGSKAVDRGHRSVHFLGRSAPGKGNTPKLESGGGVQGAFFNIFVGFSRVQDRRLPGGPQGRERSRCRALGNPLQAPLGPLERGAWLVVRSQRCSFSRPFPLSAEDTR